MGVRVRPLNLKERSDGHRCITRCIGTNELILMDPDVTAYSTARAKDPNQRLVQGAPAKYVIPAPFSHPYPRLPQIFLSIPRVQYQIPPKVALVVSSPPPRPPYPPSNPPQRAGARSTTPLTTSLTTTPATKTSIRTPPPSTSPASSAASTRLSSPTGLPAAVRPTRWWERRRTRA